MAKKKKKKDKGVAIEFLSRQRLSEKTFDDKLDLIFERVRNRTIVVMEESLSPDEKRELITRSMEETDDEFPGIEFVGFDAEPTLIDDIVARVTGRERREGLVVVGASDVVEKVKEDRDAISLLAKAK